MSFLRSFRFRIAGLAVLLSSAVLAVCGVSAWSLTYRLGLDGVDQQLRDEIRRHSNESRRPNHWERIERSLQNAPDVLRDRVTPAVAARERGDHRVAFQSSNWPRGIAVTSLPDPPEPPPPRPQPEFFRPGDPRSRPGPNPQGFGPPNNQPPPGGGQPGGFGPPEGVSPGPPPPVSFGTFRTFPTASGNWRIGAGGSERFTFLVAMSLAPLDRNLAQLARAMFAAAIPGLLLIAAAGGFLASRALRPVARLTATAESITARDLRRRLPATREAGEFQRLTDVFNDMLDRLEKSFLQATRFSADAAHELKTPLAILQGQIEQSLREAADGTEQQRLCADLLEEVQRLKNIVRKLLLLSLADAGELRLNREPVDLTALVADAADDARILAPRLRIETKLSDDLRTAADPDLLGQVVQNLVGNAIKYNRDGGFVRLELGRTPAGPRLAVTNSGDPVPPEHQSRIFDRFYRVESSRTRAADGLGLGLSLAREIARAHGGELSLERSDASGTTFTLVLPPS